MNKILLPVILFILSQTLQAQTALETTRKVADYIVQQTPFVYETDLAKPSKSLEELQSIDFKKNFGSVLNTAAFAYTNLHSVKDTSIALHFSYAGSLSLQLNNQVVFIDTNQHQLSYRFLERSIELEKNIRINLKKGNNPLLIKTTCIDANQWILLMCANKSSIQLSLDGISSLSKQVLDYTNFLIAGGFMVKNKKDFFSTQYEHETSVLTTTLFHVDNYPFTWTIPSIQLTHQTIQPKKYWGTYYNYNYHTAGVAWAIAKLGYLTQQQQYLNFSKNYCAFILKEKPFVTYQVRNLWQTNATDYLMVNTPLLDFTSAPCMPFLYRLIEEPTFPERNAYEAFFKEIKTYIFQQQIRLNKQNFTRATPEKYTTWVDDMFMGLPFVIYASRASKDIHEQKQLQNDAAQQVLAFAKLLFDPKDSLFHHAQHSSRPSIKYPYWLRANGWGIWAITEVLKYLPKNHEAYTSIMSLYKAHITKLVQQQDNTGLWHNIINNPSTKLETSGSSIITLVIARGIVEGWLDKKTYLPIVTKAWKAIGDKVEADGQVNDIIVGSFTNEDYHYYENQPFVKNDSHGMLCVLMCGLEMHQLEQLKSN